MERIKRGHFSKPPVDERIHHGMRPMVNSMERDAKVTLFSAKDKEYVAVRQQEVKPLTHILYLF